MNSKTWIECLLEGLEPAEQIEWLDKMLEETEKEIARARRREFWFSVLGAVVLGLAIAFTLLQWKELVW